MNLRLEKCNTLLISQNVLSFRSIRLGIINRFLIFLQKLYYLFAFSEYFFPTNRINLFRYHIIAVEVKNFYDFTKEFWVDIELEKDM